MTVLWLPWQEIATWVGKELRRDTDRYSTWGEVGRAAPIGTSIAMVAHAKSSSRAASSASAQAVLGDGRQGEGGVARRHRKRTRGHETQLTRSGWPAGGFDADQVVNPEKLVAVQLCLPPVVHPEKIPARGHRGSGQVDPTASKP